MELGLATVDVAAHGCLEAVGKHGGGVCGGVDCVVAELLVVEAQVLGDVVAAEVIGVVPHGGAIDVGQELAGLLVVRVVREDGAVTVGEERVGGVVGACLVVLVAFLDHSGEVDANLEVLGGCEVGVDAAAVALEVGLEQEALLLEVADGGEGVEAVGGAGGVEGVFLAVAAAGDGVPPVKVVVLGQDGAGELTVEVEDGGLVSAVHVHRDVRAGDDAFLEILGDVVGCPSGGGEELVEDTCVGLFHPLVGAEGLVAGQAALVHTLADAEVDIDFADFLGALGGDEHYAIGTLVAVKGAGCGVLEHGHGLDVLGVEVVDAGVVRHAVNYVERVVVAGHGAEAADTDLGLGTGLADCVVDLYAGGVALEGGGDVADGSVLDFLGADNGNGTGQGLLVGRTVGNDYHVFEVSGRGGEVDGHAGGDVDGLRGVAHIRNFHLGDGCGDGELELAVDVARCALAAANGHHGGSHQRLVVGRVEDCACDSLCLCRQGPAAGQNRHQN